MGRKPLTMELGQLYVKIYYTGKESALTKNSVLVCAPYGKLTRRESGRLYMSLLRVKKEQCEDYIHCWIVSYLPGRGIFEKRGRFRSATDEDLRTLITMLDKTGPTALEQWLEHLRSLEKLGRVGLKRIEQIAAEVKTPVQI